MTRMILVAFERMRCLVAGLLLVSTSGLEPSSLSLSRRRYIGSTLVVAITSVSDQASAEKDELFDQNTVCARRGLLGKCIDDTGKSDDSVAPVASAAKGGRLLEREEESSELIQRLRERSIENRAKNDRKIELESFANSQSGLFGPFSRYEPVMKTDGSFVLVLARDFERLKKEKRIIDGCFIDDADAKPYERKVPLESKVSDSSTNEDLK